MSNQTFTPKDFKSDQQIRWCPGCGDYAIINSLQKVMADYFPSHLIGEIPTTFTDPIIPKIVILGLFESSEQKFFSPQVLNFKVILEKALQNLFVIEFAEQVHTCFNIYKL